MAANSLFAVDIETTGMSAAFGDRVIEVGVVCIQHGIVSSGFEQLIQTSRRISRDAARVHGITKQMLQGQPLANEVFSRFREFIGSHILISHNAQFEARFLRQEFACIGRLFSNRLICTLELARHRMPGLPNYRLETVARQLLGDLPSDVHLHRALDDARLTARVWLALRGSAGGESARW